MSIIEKQDRMLPTVMVGKIQPTFHPEKTAFIQKQPERLETSF